MRALPTPFAVACLLLGASAPQDPPAAPAAPVLQRAQELAQTVPAHARLRRFVGQWDVVVRAAGADAGASEHRGTAVGKEILGGRYVVLSFQLRVGGQGLEAVQILGYDTLRQVYTSSWRDDHSTWPVECSGTEVAAASGRLQLHGTLADARDAAGRAFRLDLELQADDRVVATLHDTVDGRLTAVQTQHWTRR